MKKLLNVLLAALMFSAISLPAFGAAGSNIAVIKQLGAGEGIAEIQGGKLDYLGLPQTAVITACANATTVSSSITVPEFAGWSTTLFSYSKATSDYVLWVEQVDAADGDTIFISQWRAIVSLSATGVIVVVPAFTGSAGTETLDAGDIVSVRPWSSVNPCSQTLYHGYASSGSATTAFFPDLVGKAEAIVDDATIKCVKDISAGTYDGATSTVNAYLASTGRVIFTTGMMTPAVGDEFVITWTPASEFIYGASGLPSTPTAQRLIAGVNLAESQKWIEASVDSVRGQKVFSVTTSTAGWDAAGTYNISAFSGTGIWKLEALGGVNVSGNTATGTNLRFILRCSAIVTYLTGNTAIENDAANVVYTVGCDTIGGPVIEQAVNVPFAMNPYGITSRHMVPLDVYGVAVYTPPGNWTINDSCSATNTGTRYLYLRATPITAGATLTAN